MHYIRYLMQKLIHRCLCCRGCKKRNQIRFAQYLQYKEAMKRLDCERDLKVIISLNRVSRFLHILHLNRKQRSIVPNSQTYTIFDEDLTKSKTVYEAPLSITEALEDFDPGESQIDRRLLFEVTKHSVICGEFSDESESLSDPGDKSPRNTSI